MGSITLARNMIPTSQDTKCTESVWNLTNMVPFYQNVYFLHVGYKIVYNRFSQSKLDTLIQDACQYHEWHVMPLVFLFVCLFVWSVFSSPPVVHFYVHSQVTGQFNIMGHNQTCISPYLPNDKETDMHINKWFGSTEGFIGKTNFIITLP